MLNLDTHILIFALTDALTPRERKLLGAQPWSISAIVLWEIAKLSQRGRIDVDLDDANLLRVLSNMRVWPIDLEVCRMSINMDFKGDPADEIIAATSVVYDLPLVTRDGAIRASRIVPLA